MAYASDILDLHALFLALLRENGFNQPKIMNTKDRQQSGQIMFQRLILASKAIFQS